MQTKVKDYLGLDYLMAVFEQACMHIGHLEMQNPKGHGNRQHLYAVRQATHSLCVALIVTAQPFAMLLSTSFQWQSKHGRPSYAAVTATPTRSLKKSFWGQLTGWKGLNVLKACSMEIELACRCPLPGARMPT